jgi:hypothetical protein
MYLTRKSNITKAPILRISLKQKNFEMYPLPKVAIAFKWEGAAAEVLLD